MNEPSRKPAAGAAPKKKKILRRLLLWILMFTLVFMPVSNAVGYEAVFRFLFTEKESGGPMPSDYPELSCKEYSFETDRGRKLSGYLYSMNVEDTKDITDPNTLIVFAHGIGSDHRAYTGLIVTLARNGYPVFAYDAYSFGKSEGTYTGGLVQGVIDIDHALDFAESLDECRGMEVAVIGHSWGAYSAGAVLKDHPEIRTAVLLSGFNASSDMLRAEAGKYVGPVVNLLLPYVKLYERLKFGAYSTYTVCDGVRNSDARVMIVQGTDDDVVLPKYGIDLFEEAFSGNDRVTIRRLEGYGHTLPLEEITDMLPDF